MDPSQPNQDFRSIVSRLSFSDFNRVLFRSDPEEQSDGKNFGAYSIPNFGAPPYCGLQGKTPQYFYKREWLFLDNWEHGLLLLKKVLLSIF